MKKFLGYLIGLLFGGGVITIIAITINIYIVTPTPSNYPEPSSPYQTPAPGFEITPIIPESPNAGEIWNAIREAGYWIWGWMSTIGGWLLRAVIFVGWLLVRVLLVFGSGFIVLLIFVYMNEKRSRQAVNKETNVFERRRIKNAEISRNIIAIVCIIILCVCIFLIFPRGWPGSVLWSMIWD